MHPKNRYEIELGRKVGLIELGMTRQEVVSILGEPEDSEEHTFYLSEHYDFGRLHLNYELNTELCKAIEISDSELIYKDKYQDVDLLSLSWERLFEWMCENDPRIDVIDDTFISHELKIATGPKLDEELGTELAESILTFTEDYWLPEEEIISVAKRENNATPSLEEFAKQNGLERFLQFFEPEP